MFEYDPSIVSRSSPSPPRRAILAEKYEKEKQRKIDSSIASATSFSMAKNENNDNVSSASDATSIQNTIDPDAYIISLLQNAEEEKKNATTTATATAKTKKSSSSSPVLLYLDYSPAVVKTLSNMHKNAQSKAQSSHAARSSERVKKNIGHLLVGVFGEKRLKQFFDNVDEFEVEGEEKKHADDCQDGESEEEDDDDDNKKYINEEGKTAANEEDNATTKNNTELQRQPAKQTEKKEVVGASLGFLLGLGNEILSGENEDDENPRKNRNNNTKDEVAAASDDEEMFLREIENAKRVLQHKNTGIDGNKTTTTAAIKKPVEKKQELQEKKETEIEFKQQDAEEQQSSPSTQDLVGSATPLFKSTIQPQKLKTILQTRKRCQLTSLPDPSVLLEMIVQEHTEMRRQSEKEEVARYRNMVQGIELGKYYDDNGNEIYGSNGNISSKKTGGNQNNNNSATKKDLSSGFIEHFHAKLNWAIQELFQSQRTTDQVQAQYNHFVLEAARRIDTLEKSIDSFRDEKIAHEETKQELERERDRAMILFEGTSNNINNDQIENEQSTDKAANINSFQSIEDNDPNSTLLTITKNNNNAILRRGRFRSLPSPSSNMIHSHHQRRPLLSTSAQFLSCDKLILQQQQKLAEQEEKFLQQQQQKQQNNEKNMTPPPTFSSIAIINHGDNLVDDVSWQKDHAPSRATPQLKNNSNNNNHLANSKTCCGTANNAPTIHREVSTRNDYTELNNQMLSLTYEIASLKDANNKLKHQLEVGLVQQENNFQTAFDGLNSERDSLKKALDATKEELYVAQRLKGNSTDEIQALSHMLLSMRKELAKMFDVLFVDKEKHLSDFLLATSPFDAPVAIFREFFSEGAGGVAAEEGNKNINLSDGDDSGINNNNNNILLNKQFTKNWKDNLRSILSKEPNDDQIGRLSPLEPTTTTHLMNIGLVTLNQIRSLYSQLLNSINDTTQRQRVVAKNFMANQKEVRKNIAQRRKDDDHKSAKLVSALESAQEKLVELVRENKALKSSIGDMTEENKKGDDRIQQLLVQVGELKKHLEGERDRTRPKTGDANSSRRAKSSHAGEGDDEEKNNESNENSDHEQGDETCDHLDNLQVVLQTNKTSAAPLALDENAKNKNGSSSKGPSSLLGLLNQNQNKNKVDSANSKLNTKGNSDKKSSSTPTKKQQQNPKNNNNNVSATAITTTTTTASTSKTASRTSSAGNKNGKKIKSRTTSFVHQNHHPRNDDDDDGMHHKNDENDDQVRNVVANHGSETQIDMETQTPERLLFSLVKELAEELILTEREGKHDAVSEKRVIKRAEDDETAVDADGGDQVQNIKNMTNERNNNSHAEGATPAEENLEQKVSTEEKSTQYESASIDGASDELQPEEITPDFAKVLSALDEIGLDQKLLRNFKTLRLNDEMLQYIDNEDLIAVGLELVAHRRAFFFSIGKSPDLARSARKLDSGEQTENNNNVESNVANTDENNNNNDPNWWSSSMKSKVVGCQTVAPETKSKYAQTTVDLTLPPSILDKTADDSALERYRPRKEQEEKVAAAEKLKQPLQNNAGTSSPSATSPPLFSQKPISVTPVHEEKTTSGSTVTKPQSVVSAITTTNSHQVGVASSSETPKKKDQLDLDALLADATDYLKKNEKEKESKANNNDNNTNNDDKPSSASFRKSPSSSPSPLHQQQQVSTAKPGAGGKKNNNNSSPTAKNNKEPGSPGRGGGGGGAGEKKGGKKSAAFDDNNNNDDQLQLIGVSQAEHDGLQRKYDTLNSAYTDASLRVRQLEAEGGQSNTKLKMTSDQLRSTTERLIETQKSRDTEQIAAREAQLDLESAKDKLGNLEKKLLHAEEKRMQEALRAVDDMKRVQEQLEAALHSDVVDKLKAKEKLFLGGSQAMMQALKSLMNSVVCPHCLEPLREACVHVPCGHVICRRCITRFHEEDVGCTIRLDPVTNLFSPSGISYNVKSTKNVNSTSSFFNVNKKFESNSRNNKEKHVVAVLPSREYLLPPPAGGGERFTPIRGSPVVEVAKNIRHMDDHDESNSGDIDGGTPSSSIPPPQLQQQQNVSSASPQQFVSLSSSPPLPRLQNNNSNASPLSPAAATQLMLNSLHLCCAECERTGGVDGSGLSGMFGLGTGLRSGSSAISLTGFVTDIPPTQIVRFPLMDTLVASAEFALKSAEQSRRAVIKNSMVVDAREDGEEDADVLVNESKMKRIELETEKSVLNLESSAATVSVKPIMGSRIHAAALRGRLLPEPQGVDLGEEENVGVNGNSKQRDNNNNNEPNGENGRGKSDRKINNNNSGEQKSMNVHDKAIRDKNPSNSKMSGNAFAKAADDWV